MDSTLQQLNADFNAGKIELGTFLELGAAIRDKRDKRAKVTVYRTDAVIERRSWTPACAGTVSKRKKIGSAPSSRSLRNLVFVLNNCDIPMKSMLTLTMTPLCHNFTVPSVHRKAFKLALQRLRDRGVRNWVWVREFQKNGSVHWHVFSDLEVGSPGEVNEDLSHDWSEYWSALYFDRLLPKSAPTNKQLQKRLKLSRRHMERGNGSDFLGCCRFEQLKTEAAGRYASKEGGKRFQKIAPGEWKEEGGAWWRPAKGITCTPIKTSYVDQSRLQKQTITTHEGKQLEIAMKLQYSLGLKLLNEK